jgi:transitional endoplasmic reticulum ATPase
MGEFLFMEIALMANTDTLALLAQVVDDALDARSGDEGSRKKARKVAVADVTRYEGPGIQVPHNMPLRTAVNILTRKLQEDETTVPVSASIPAFPYDGAYAMSQAMTELFGYVIADNKKDWMGNNSNENMELVIDHKGTTVTVPWGRFQVPGIDGVLTTGFTWEGKTVIFQIEGEIKGGSVPAFKMLVEKTKEIVRDRSIYRGKALRVRFTDDQGRTMPVPEIHFVDVEQATQPIFSQHLEDTMRYDVMTYVEQPELARSFNNGTLKRGVLLAGPYGTGKTLTASWVARRAVEQGFTFWYVDKPENFHSAYLLAMGYQPSILFVEDVDSIAGHERTEEVNQLLNVLDGVATKRADIISIFTTNHGEKISDAMRRPGRLDLILQIEAPDAEAAIRLVKSYAQGLVEESDDFTAAGKRLAGMIPAVIKEAVARARFRAAARTGDANGLINNEDLVGAATAIGIERGLFGSPDESELAKVGVRVAKYVTREMTNTLAKAENEMTQTSNPETANVKAAAGPSR